MCASLSADVENVVNFDFPPTPEAYVHRVGRYVFITVSYMATGFCHDPQGRGGGGSCQSQWSVATECEIEYIHCSPSH